MSYSRGKEIKVVLLFLAVMVFPGTSPAGDVRGWPVPGLDFSRPYFPTNKPQQNIAGGGKWGFSEGEFTRCRVVGTDAERHTEMTLDPGGQAAGLWYTDNEASLPGGAWRIVADIRADLGYSSAKSPERWFYLTGGDQNAPLFLAMKFFPDKTVVWTTPTQNGTFSSATGIDGSVWRRVHFDYDPGSGRAAGGLDSEIVFETTTTPGMTIKTIAFLHSAPIQGTGTFYIDNVGSDTISIPGDVNGDGFVDSLDRAIVNQNLTLGPGATWSQGDLSGNGVVDATDLNLVTANMGHAGPPTDLLTGIIPEPRQVYHFNGRRSAFTVGSTTALVLDSSASKLVKDGAALLQADLHTLTGFSVPLVYKTFNWGPGLVLCNDTTQAGSIANALRETISGLPVQGSESYRLAGDSRGFVITAPASAGVFYGMQTLRQMVHSGGTVPALAIADWPDQAIRACYIASPGDPEAFVKRLARLKINMCVVESPWYYGANWWYNCAGINLDAAQTFFSLCRQYNIEPVPLVQGFGWGYGVVDQNPGCAEGIWVQNESHLLIGTIPVDLSHRNVLPAPSPIVVTNSAGTRTYVENTDYQIIPGTTIRPFEPANPAWKIVRIAAGGIASGEIVKVNYNYMNNSVRAPYCPSEPLTYQIVDAVLQNVIATFHPKYIHIGHDEVDYVRRCSRCLANPKTALELIQDDIAHWYGVVKAADPTIKVMMWDDLARSDATNGSALSAVAADVIICPWVYEDASTMTTPTHNGEQEIAARMAWFVGTNCRPTLGAASGFYSDNIWLWKNAMAQYAGNPACLGFMFNYFGDSENSMSTLTFSEEYMWSRNKPADKGIFDLYAHAEKSCQRWQNNKGLGLTLPLYDQRQLFADLVNQETAAGRDARIDADALAASLAADRDGILAAILPELAATNIAAGTVPERAVTQMDALPAYYWAMAAFVQARKLHETGSKADALDLLAQIASRFTQWHFQGYENADQWVNNYRDNNVFPTSQDLFGVTLNSL